MGDVLPDEPWPAEVDMAKVEEALDRALIGGTLHQRAHSGGGTAPHVYVCFAHK